ncbi:serine protease [Lentzea sp. CC55]|uniref:trypsin-like serine peptidase n=1 Tax=Lentzea sp. CC55 TaxID=2884909 RepID=UPI001F23D580|nr:trypsin-like peptidase domain-containing protein [Lentzea sp. CC55]MCG8927430.1 trypsin-like serine protease [Lentzea sp. CC55]
MPKDRPDPLDRIIAQSRPQQADAPAEVNDPRNFLVFDRLPSARPADDAVFTTGRDGRLAVSDPGTVLGVVVGAVEPVTPEAVKAELDEQAGDGDSSAYIPDWTAVSVTPSLAPAVEHPRLVRRSGARVRPEWVIDPDARSAYYPNSYPFSLVGRLFVWQDAAHPNWSWWGTASLLGVRTILTASHVVPWGSSNWKALFVPAFYDGASIHGAWAASWVTNAQGYRNHAQGDDMAVMRLDVPLGNSLGWFGFRTYNSAWQDQNVWTLPGYPWDKDSGNRPWLHLNFPIIDDDNDGAGVELEYRADTEGGQSGAPVFAWFNGSPDVVGTHSGGEDNFGEPRQNVAAGGNALTNLLHWARNNWP